MASSLSKISFRLCWPATFSDILVKDFAFGILTWFLDFEIIRLLSGALLPTFTFKSAWEHGNYNIIATIFEVLAKLLLKLVDQRISVWTRQIHNVRTGFSASVLERFEPHGVQIASIGIPGHKRTARCLQLLCFEMCANLLFFHSVIYFEKYL